MTSVQPLDGVNVIFKAARWLTLAEKENNKNARNSTCLINIRNKYTRTINIQYVLIQVHRIRKGYLNVGTTVTMWILL